jgi:hypothetical protein
MIDERAKRARPDVFAADQAQPVEPLVVAQTNVRGVSQWFSEFG